MTSRKSHTSEPGLQNFGDPKSVVKYAPTTGVFASDVFLGDSEGFVNKLIFKWFNIPGNTIPSETSEHLAQAEALFPLYETIRANSDRLHGKMGPILGKMNQTGCVAETQSILDSVLSGY